MLTEAATESWKEKHRQNQKPKYVQEKDRSREEVGAPEKGN